jgi:hypothetical protein
VLGSSSLTAEKGNLNAAEALAKRRTAGQQPVPSDIRPSTPAESDARYGHTRKIFGGSTPSGSCGSHNGQIGLSKKWRERQTLEVLGQNVHEMRRCFGTTTFPECWC